MKLARWAIACLLLPLAPPAFAWGPQGHHIVAAIALEHMEEGTRQQLYAILGDESLADASTWPDRMRSNPSKFWQETARPFHYVTVPPGKTYRDVGAPRKGDAVKALRDFRSQLLNPRESLAQRQLALRFSIHIVADLHQPLHVGNGEDLGGNRIKVRLLGKRSNLHAVWDSGLLRQGNRSTESWARWLGGEITAGQAQAWADPDPLVWVAESAELRDRIYPDDAELGWDYVHAHMPDLQRRLQQAGVRTAAYLDGLWKP